VAADIAVGDFNFDSGVATQVDLSIDKIFLDYYQIWMSQWHAALTFFSHSADKFTSLVTMTSWHSASHDFGENGKGNKSHMDEVHNTNIALGNNKGLKRLDDSTGNDSVGNSTD
jgi:hypothetical protein